LEGHKALKGKTTTCHRLILPPRHPLLALTGDTILGYADLPSDPVQSLVSAARVLNFLLEISKNTPSFVEISIFLA